MGGASAVSETQSGIQAGSKLSWNPIRRAPTRQLSIVVGPQAGGKLFHAVSKAGLTASTAHRRRRSSGCREAAQYAAPMTTIQLNALSGPLAELESHVADAEAVAGFTGAGISTESGIPDFRSPGSPWTRHKPIPFEAFTSSAAARREAWRRKFAIDDLSRGAGPSRGHRALASLVVRGRMTAVITQNIDG